MWTIWCSLGAALQMPPKHSRKTTENLAPWWWGPAVCELWAVSHKPNTRARFHKTAVYTLDEVYGKGCGYASKAGWQNAGGSRDCMA